MERAEAKGGGSFGYSPTGGTTFSLQAETAEGHYVRIEFADGEIAKVLAGGQRLPCTVTILEPPK